MHNNNMKKNILYLYTFRNQSYKVQRTLKDVKFISTNCKK